MSCYYLGLCSDFACLAGECPSTCCAGWKIVVDTEAKKRFEVLKNDVLREDILEHIQWKEGEYRFENQPDGRCTMLDDDGLCRIQRQLDEKALCNTCRKFPRLTARVGRDVWMSMSASCPVVAGYLWKQRTSYRRQKEDGVSQEIDFQMFHPVKEGMTLYQKHCQTIENQRQQFDEFSGENVSLLIVRENWHRYELFLDITDGVLELIAEFPERPYLKGSFDYFERTDKGVSEIFQDMELFASVWQQSFFRFIKNYLPYRLFSRFLEYQEEDLEHRYCQVMGELSVIYVILFSRFHTLERMEQGHILETIDWVYRFCVHGAVLSKKVTEFFFTVFEEREDFVRLILKL